MSVPQPRTIPLTKSRCHLHDINSKDYNNSLIWIATKIILNNILDEDTKQNYLILLYVGLLLLNVHIRFYCHDVLQRLKGRLLEIKCTHWGCQSCSQFCSGTSSSTWPVDPVLGWISHLNWVSGSRRHEKSLRCSSIIVPQLLQWSKN